MKSKILFAALACVAIVFVSCKPDDDPTKKDNTHFLSGNMPTKVTCFNNLIKDPEGVHLFVIDDYNFEQMVEDNDAKKFPAAGCSEARKGNFVSRNLDWYQLDQPVYAISVPKTDKHQGSLTVCGLDEHFTHKSDMSSIGCHQANTMMACATDGMNTAGVYIGVNVCPFDEMKEKTATGAINYKAPKGTVNAEKKQLTTNYVCRLVLDQATSVQDAKEIIRGTNWIDFPMLQEAGFQAHWLIADKNSSCVCEFIDGEPVFIDAKGPESADYGNIMTNFSNYLGQKGVIQSHGAGYERFEVLQRNYAKAEGVEGAKNLCRAVFFSRAYKEPMTTQDFFWTDWATRGITAQDAIAWKNDPTSRTGEKWDILLQTMEDYKAVYDWKKWGYDVSDQTSPEFRGAWYTTHSSVWNLEDMSLVLDVEENNTFDLHITIDGKIVK